MVGLETRDGARADDDEEEEEEEREEEEGEEREEEEGLAGAVEVNRREGTTETGAATTTTARAAARASPPPAAAAAATAAVTAVLAPPLHAVVSRSLRLRTALLLHGPSGVGKRSAVEEAAASLGAAFGGGGRPLCSPRLVFSASVATRPIFFVFHLSSRRKRMSGKTHTRP